MLRDRKSLPPHKRRYHFSEVPLHLQDNPYIFTGYRAFLTAADCTKTLLGVHNEMMNVWSHLLGFIWALWVFWDTIFVLFPTHDAGLGEYIVTIIYLLCVMFCMWASAAYHLYLPQAQAVSLRWLQLDLLGITIGMLGSFFPGIYYGFYCFNGWMKVHSFLSGVVFVVNLALQSHKNFLSKQWSMRRIILYAFTLGFGLVPLTHWSIINHGAPEEVALFVPKVLISYLLMAIGLAFYVTKFPERSCPGSCDILFGSHQWWHFFVFLTFYWWYHAGVEMFHYRLNTPCPAVSV